MAITPHLWLLSQMKSATNFSAVNPVASENESENMAKP